MKFRMSSSLGAARALDVSRMEFGGEGFELFFEGVEGVGEGVEAGVAA